MTSSDSIQRAERLVTNARFIAYELPTWEGRDDQIPQPEITKLSYELVDTVDIMLRDLNALRSHLTQGIRVSEDIANERVDALLRGESGE